jgi:hypothetical protein
MSYELTLPSGRVVTTAFADFKLSGRSSVRGDFPDRDDIVEGYWRGRVKGVHLDEDAKKGVILLAIVEVSSATLAIVPPPEPPPSLFDKPAEATEIDVAAVLTEHVATCRECTVEGEQVLVRCELYDKLESEYGRPEVPDADAGAEQDAGTGGTVEGDPEGPTTLDHNPEGSENSENPKDLENLEYFGAPV